MEHIVGLLPGSSDQLDEKMDTLKRKLQVLESKQDDVKEELKQVEYSLSTKKPRKEVQHWLAEFGRIKTEVQQKEKEVHERRSWWGNQELRRSVDKLRTEVEELAEQSKFPRGLTLESHEREGVPIPTSSLIGETFQKNKSEILDCLMGDEDSVFGIYGMGGVGKTTLLTHIHNELLERHISVSWVTVSQNFSIQKLQHDIAKAIGLDISKEDDERIRAAQLAWAFQRKKNFILILDDVWENISLEKVGICVGENGRKLILTTRSLEVCQMINRKKKIKVEPLSNEEARALFVKTLGNWTLLSDQIKEIAESLVKECDGLPLGIIVMAGSMRGVGDVSEWSNALEEIKEAKYRNDDMEFYNVFCILKHSFDRLKDPKVQGCLLYCSLFPEDALIEIDQLIERFIDERLIDGTIKSRQSKIDKGRTILKKLEKVCLLEHQLDVEGQECVKMHDLIRDMAIKIARASHPFWVQSGMQLKDIPNDEGWSEDLVRVSLLQNNIQGIPLDSSPKCPKLLTLLLCKNYSLRTIPSSFFVHMKSLTVLDLSSTNIESLPSSISDLESLIALSLGNCYQLRFVPSLENLTALRRLDLRSSAIKEVPKGLEKLINLRYLSFEGCFELWMMPDGILSKLPQIEYFESSEKVTLRGKEIGTLKKLETFCGRFEDISEFNSCIRLWEEWKPEEYSIFVGYDDFRGIDFGKYRTNFRWINLRKYRTNVILIGAKGSEDTLVLPRGSETGGIEFLKLQECHGITSLSHNDFVFLRLLKISGCHGLKRVFTPTLLSNLQHLKRCEVKDCSQLVEIIGETSDEDENRKSTTAVMLPKLKHLSLFRLPELKSFCNSSIKVSDSLKDITILECPRLMRITLLWEGPHPSLQSVRVEKDWWDTVEWKHPKTKDDLQPYLWSFAR